MLRSNLKTSFLLQPVKALKLFVLRVRLLNVPSARLRGLSCASSILSALPRPHYGRSSEITSIKENKLWVRWFLILAMLVLAQVGWWTIIFLRDVASLSELKTENLQLETRLGSIVSTTPEKIANEAFHRRLMILSESVFFAFITCLGLYLLYRALRVEQRSRDIQHNFIEMISHESKTPLTALKLRLESVREKDPKWDRDLGLALEEVRRLASVFEKAMSLNRMERQAFSCEPIRLAEVVKQVIRRLDPFLKARGVEVALELDPDAVVQGDAYGLQNTVQSLIENAVLHNSHSDRHVELQVRREESKVFLDVSDNGPGISDKDKAHLFERFFRGQTGKNVPGTGLGLYIARTIVEAHKGKIRLVPPTLGGASFRIELEAV